MSYKRSVGEPVDQQVAPPRLHSLARSVAWGPQMANEKCSILIVDDEPYILSTLSVLIGQEFEVLTAGSADAAEKIFSQRPIDILLTDQRMPRRTGVQLLEWVKQHSPRTIRLLMTGYAEFEDAVEAINRGQVFRYLFKPWRTDELLQVLHDASRTFRLEKQNQHLVNELQQVNDELRRLNTELEERVQQRTKELEEANHLLQQRSQMLEKLALTDPLTLLPNRRAMDRLAESEIRRQTRYPSWLTLGVLDVDHFKEINRRYLLPGGDQVLIDLARTLISCVRTVDHVGRIGGEEFLIVAPETNLEGAVRLGERIRSAIEENRFSYKGQAIKVTASIGLAVTEPGQPTDYTVLKHLASEALGEAKAQGRNRVIVRQAVPCSPQVG